MVAIFVMGIGLLVAVPVWKTQIQREKEEELIFRGKQYVEAIRIYQMSHPGSFPRSLDELLEKKCIRQLYKDPITKEGKWNIILTYGGISKNKGSLLQKILVAPPSALSNIENPQIIGVVSSSPDESIKIYFNQDTYDKWIFFYGQDPEKMPEIVYYGQTKKD